MRMLGAMFRRLACCTFAIAGCSIASAAAFDDEPLYRDGFEYHDPQSLVLDAFNRSSTIRIVAREIWGQNGQLPASLTQMGYVDPSRVGSAWATLQSGVLKLDFTDELAGESLAFAAWLQAGVFHWSCGHAMPPLESTLVSGSGSSAQTTLSDAMLPDPCRSVPSAAALVDDAWNATNRARSRVAEYWNTSGQPADLAEVGLVDPLPVARAHLQLDDGVLVATFVDQIAGETLAIAPWSQAGVLRWVCAHAPIPVDATLLSTATSVAQTSLPEAVLPEACRSNPSAESQVMDALLGMSSARTNITEFWQLNTTLPSTLAETGLPDPYPAAQARLQLVDGVLVATFVGTLEGKTFGIAPWQVNGNLTWACGYGNPPAGATPLASSTAAAQTTLDADLLPKSCR